MVAQVHQRLEWDSNDVLHKSKGTSDNSDIRCIRKLGMWRIFRELMVHVALGRPHSEPSHYSEGAGPNRGGSSYLGYRVDWQVKQCAVIMLQWSVS